MKKRFLSLALSAVLALSALTPAALAAEYTEIVPPKYDDIRLYKDSSYDDNSLIPVQSGEKWGFIDINGKEIVPLKYDDAEYFSEGLASVKVDGKWGFIDTTGKEVVPPKYDDADYFSEGLAAVRLGDRETGKWGLIDTTGKEVVPPKYSEIGHQVFYTDYKPGSPTNTHRNFSEGLAVVRLGEWGDPTHRPKYGYIDTTGKEVVPPKYDDVGNFSEGLAAVNVDGKYGFIDTTGKEVIPPKYVSVGPFSEGLAKVYLDGKYGFIDTTGKEVVPPKYDNIEPFSEGLARVCLGRKYGFIDTTGKEVVPLKYDEAGNFFGGLAVVRLGSYDGPDSPQYGFIDTTGKESFFPKYDRIDDFSDGLARVCIDDRYGYIDTTGREVVPVKYDDEFVDMGFLPAVQKCYEGMAVVRLDGKYGCYNAAGQEILPIKYGFINQFTDGFAVVYLDEKYGVVDKTGKEIVPLQYSSISDTNVDGLMVVQDENRKEGLIRVSTSTPAPTVPPSPCAVTLNGKAITLNAYLFTENGGGSNYVMLRDIAMLLNGTKAQFDVSWAADVGITITTGSAYTPVGGELQGKGTGEKGYTANSSTITVDGKPVSLGGYTIESNNYFKLRDLGTALGFTVDWDAATGTVVLSTNG